MKYLTYICAISFVFVFCAAQDSISRLEAEVKTLQKQFEIINQKAEYGAFYKHDQEMLKSHARNGTVWIMSTNKAMLPLAFNLLCSIAHFDASLIDSIVFHAVDVDAKVALERHRWHDQWRFDTKSGAIPTYGKHRGFGVLYNPLFSGTSDHLTWDNPEYEKLMRTRPAFFLTILRTMGLNILFSDVDIVYYQDPLKFVTDNYLTGDADMALSTDARNMFYDLGEEKERYHNHNIKVPSFCGGFFFAKSNQRTISFFEKLQYFLEYAYDTNDQTGFERVLDEQTDLRLVGRIPEGLCTKPGLNADVLVGDSNIVSPIDRSVENNQDILAVHILDQWQFINGATYEKQQEQWETDRQTGKLSGEFAQVLKHANFPGSVKFEKMRKYGWWFLGNNDETCLPVSSSSSSSVVFQDTL